MPESTNDNAVLCTTHDYKTKRGGKQDFLCWYTNTHKAARPRSVSLRGGLRHHSQRKKTGTNREQRSRGKETRQEEKHTSVAAEGCVRQGRSSATRAVEGRDRLNGVVPHV